MASPAAEGTTDRAALDLLVDLVSTPSVSGQEQAVADKLEAWAMQQGLATRRDENGLLLTAASAKDGPTLLLATHLDTVPPTGDWSSDPFRPVVTGDSIRGLGAVDAKASVATMAVAAARVQQCGGPARGRLCVLTTFCEETKDTTMPAALKGLDGPIDAAIVGEPTLLQPCIAQRGLLILKGIWHGEQQHAGWVDEKARSLNVIQRAASDLTRVAELAFDESHELLGKTSVVPTVIRAGDTHNVVPETCEVLWDVRTTPALAHDAIVDRIAAALESGTLEIVSNRYHPAQTPPGSKLLECIHEVHSGAQPFASPTASDWVWLRDVDAVKFGPGDSRQSHTPDETLPLEQLRLGAQLHQAIAQEFLV